MLGSDFRERSVVIRARSDVSRERDDQPLFAARFRHITCARELLGGDPQSIRELDTG